MKPFASHLRLAVTGSSGRIGQAIMDACGPNDPLGIDRVAGRRTSIICDIRETKQLERAFMGTDVVIHAAALHAPDVGRFSEAEFEDINIRGTLCVLAACRQAGVRRCVLTSTTAVYGGADVTSAARWITETTRPAPRTIYHRTKLAAEAAMLAANSAALQTVVVRLGRCFPEPEDVMAFHRLGRGIELRDAADAHLRAAEFDLGTRKCPVFLAVAPTPFRRSDARMLGLDAASVILRRAPSFAIACEQRGWTLPQSIDRIYDARKTFVDLKWTPHFGWQSIFTTGGSVLF